MATRIGESVFLEGSPSRSVMPPPFFLQLLANGILSFTIVNQQPKIVLTRDDHDEFFFDSLEKWEGFFFRHPRRGSDHSFEEFLRYPTFEALKLGRTRMRHKNAKARRQDTNEHKSEAFVMHATSDNQHSLKQTSMDSFFARVTNESDYESDEDAGTESSQRESSSDEE